MTRALIIDDNQSDINVLGLLLQSENATYTGVSHPQKVEEVVAEHGPFDIVFLDLEFPADNGYAILEKLRGMDSLEGVLIMAYSVHISELRAARQAGFSGFLGKPLDADRFGNQLKRILAGEPVWEFVS